MLVAATLVLVWPASWGGCTSLTVVTGHSMEPALLPGDLAVTRCGTPQVGDVIAYRPFDDQRGLVIHRIIGGDPDGGWLLRGDNNSWDDPFTPTNADVAGVMVWRVPAVGNLFFWLAGPWVWLGLLLIAAAIYCWPGRDEPAIDQPAPEPAAPDA